MPAAPKKRTVPRQRPTTAVDATVTDYLQNRSLRERSEDMEGSIKKTLLEVLAAQGDLQEGGHRQIDLVAPQVFHSYKGGKLTVKEVSGIKRQRRLSQSLNEDRTMALLKEKGLLDECTEVVVVLNEDAVLGANYGGKISDDELAGLYDENESFAFYLVEGGGA